jgi:hypothetical protein
MVRRLISSLIIASLFATGAEAAMLVADSQASILVNRGDGFQPAQSGTVVAPGDRVRVISGSASIVYDNGYAVKVGAGQMVAVLQSPPNSGGETTSSLKDPPSNMTYAYIGGGLLLAGGIGAGTVLLLNNNNKPASP